MIETPKPAKIFFKDYIFPCNANKLPALPAGFSWQRNNDKKLPVLRSEGYLQGIDCTEANITVADFDAYKPAFKNSKESQAFFEKCKSITKYGYKTQSGGYHLWFKGGVPTSVPLPGIEIKGKGSYVCIYALPFTEGQFKTHKELVATLPHLPPIPKTKTNQNRSFGPGQNNATIPHKAPKAGKHNNTDQAIEDIVSLCYSNRYNTANLKKHLRDYFGLYNKTLEKSIGSILEDKALQLTNQIITENKTTKNKQDQQTQTNSKDMPLPKNLASTLEKTILSPTTYIDKYKLLVKGHLISITGAKGSMKSIGIVKYLLENNLKILYYSDNENSKATIRKLEHWGNYNHPITWYDFEHCTHPDFWQQLEKDINKINPDVIMEDPPCEKEDFRTEAGLRERLGQRQKLAQKYNKTWIVMRNFNKSESKQIQNKVAGYRHWTQIPRACGVVIPADPDSKVFKNQKVNKNKTNVTKEGPKKMSLFQIFASNEGPLPEKAVRIILEIDPQNDMNKLIRFIPQHRSINPNNWGLGPTAEQKDETETKEYQTLSMFIDEDEDGNIKTIKIQPRKLKDNIIKMLKTGIGKTKKIIKSLKKQGLITGGGTAGIKTPDFEITQKGIDKLSEDDDSYQTYLKKKTEDPGPAPF